MLTPEQHQQHYELHARAELLSGDIAKAGLKLGFKPVPETETVRKALADAFKAVQKVSFALVDTYDIKQTF